MGDNSAVAMERGGVEVEERKHVWDVLSKYLESAVPDNDEAAEPSFGNEFINNLKRRGLVAREAIPAGRTIFVEEVITMQPLDEFESWAEYDEAIVREFARMAPVWAEEWLSLPTAGNTEHGHYASRFDEGYIPLNWGGQRVNMLGLTARFLNHACIPNAQIALLHGRGKDGRARSKISCRSCKNIHPGEEITVAYSAFYGDVATRQRDIVKTFGFECACKDCMGPKYQVEMALASIDACNEIFQSEKIVDETPAKALSIFYAVLKAYTRAGLVDIRLGELVEQCGYVCGRHSDAARAAWFIQIAFCIYRLVLGNAGYDTLKAACFLRGISRMPTFGQSTRGRTERADVALLENMGDDILRVAFMLDAEDDEYHTIQEQINIIREKNRSQEELSEEQLQDLIHDLQLEKDGEEERRKGQETAKQSKKNKKKGAHSKKKKKSGQSKKNKKS